MWHLQQNLGKILYSEISYPVFTTLLILIFNFFDTFGRYTPMIFILKGISLWIFTLSRFIFWVTFILIASDDPSISPAWLFNSTWFKFINMALYAYTNGLSSTSSMILGPANALEVCKDKAGYIMVTGIISGIFSGQLLSSIFINVGHIP